MTIAAVAAKYNANIGHDFTLADAYDADYLEAGDVEDVDLTATRERQALNTKMAEFYGIG